MTWFRSPALRAKFWLFAIMGLMVAFVVGMRLTGLHPTPPMRLAILVSVLIASGWFVIQYWRALDELAREAHKWAWYWGGAAGMGVAFAALAIRPLGLAEMFPADASPARLLEYGAMVVFFGQLVGSTIAWALWWAARR